MLLGAMANTFGGVDVKAVYGAAGNGSTDDTAELQAALDVGGALYLPPGVYVISAPLVYGSNTTLYGAGDGITVIRNTTTRTGSTLMLEPDGLGISNTRFWDVTFDQQGDVYDVGGDSTTDFLGSVNGTSNVGFYRCGFNDARTMALWADAFTANPTSGTTVWGCKVRGAGGGGFSFFGAFTGFTITDNEVSGTQDDAIAVQTSGAGLTDGGVIARNLIRDCDVQTSYGSTPHGVMVFGAENVDVLDNDIDATYASGIQVSAGGGNRASNVNVLRNKIRDAGSNNTTVPAVTPSYGIFLLSADYVTLDDNDIAGCLHGNYHEDDCTNVVKDF